jgi:16S rRNA C967 or C1407 C5-methylase (RsmB/RsmF family)
MRGLPAGVFDRVLLDPPCSALGQRPRLIQPNASLSSLAQSADYDVAFMRTAVRLLKPGGVLVYSTCTFNPLENELLVAHALRMFPELTLEPLPRHLQTLGSEGMGQADVLSALAVMREATERAGAGGAAGDVQACRKVLAWDAAKVGGLTPDQAACVRRFDPDGSDDTIGFFVARFRKQ